MDVTRDVVSDLWPLCRSGEASAGSQTLVEAFLAQDDDFAAALKATEKQARVVPALRLSPDAERRLLDQARERARRKWLVIGGAVGLIGFLLVAALGVLVFRFL